jgi:hypothetical protein
MLNNDKMLSIIIIIQIALITTLQLLKCISCVYNCMQNIISF